MPAAAANQLFDFLALEASLLAVGASVDPLLVLLAYVAAATLSMIPITPGGLGFRGSRPGGRAHAGRRVARRSRARDPALPALLVLAAAARSVSARRSRSRAATGGAASPARPDQASGEHRLQPGPQLGGDRRRLVRRRLDAHVGDHPGARRASLDRRAVPEVERLRARAAPARRRCPRPRRSRPAPPTRGRPSRSSRRTRRRTPPSAS